MRQIAIAAATVLALMLPGLPGMAAPLGEDGLHKPDWLRETFRDMREDLEEATAEGRRLLVIWEQRGCIYCTRMQEDILTRPAIDALIREKYFVVQMNLFGDIEVTDFDGTTLAEKDMARRWGVLFTPTLMFFPEEAGDAARASEVAVAQMPGAFGPITTQALLEWVVEKGYEGGEHFQRYVASKVGSLQE